MFKKTLTSLALSLAIISAGCATADKQIHQKDVRLYTLDCGTIVVQNINFFSDTDAYSDTKRTLKGGCFLIQHEEHWVLWDTGLPDALKENPTEGDENFKPMVTNTLVEQLTMLELTPQDIDYVIISHGHFDHIGNLAMFADSTLIIHEEEYEEMQDSEDESKLAALAPFKDDSLKEVKGDYDVFGDGLITTLELPGHTEGHMGLKVVLPKAGTVIISGDQYHFQENRDNQGVPDFNEDRSDTIASHSRLEGLIKNLDAKLIIQHDPKHLAKLPPLPAYLQ